MSRTATKPRVTPSSGKSGAGSGRRPSPLVLADPGKRGLALLLVTGVILTIFAGRLFEIQGIRGEALATAALDQRLRTTDLPALRGAILDSAGQPLAVTVEARNLTADQTLIKDAAAVGAQLAPLLGVDADVLATRLTGTKRFIYIAKGLTPQTWDRISELRLPGIMSESTSRRIYPAGEVGANVVGFVGADAAGLGGIEYAFQEQLAGVSGSQTSERNPRGRVIPTSSSNTIDAVPGQDVQLTIDRDIQYVAQNSIASLVRTSGAKSGTVVVMDPRTGDLLALATAPTFDANKPALSDDADRGNRILTDAFEPGSTSKLITLAAVVNEKAATPSTWIKVPGGLERGDKVFKDHTPHGTLNLTLTGVMAKSSNIGTILAAERIGKRKFARYLDKFGVGQLTGMGIPGENRGYVPPLENWSPTTFPTLAFGQGLSVNAVQATSVFATIANDGLKVQPRLVSGLIGADGTVTEPEVAPPTRVVSAEAAAQVRLMLEAVVGEGGTAQQAKIPGYRVAGKTGTAQVVDQVRGGYSREVIASFIGMAPADDPQLVVAVFVNEPQYGRYGGSLAGPIFKDVMTHALRAREIPPTGLKSPVMALTYKG
ncbi:MAG: penicillin-binding protein 2 [Candidatus Nanopelagicales bacterium]|nr:penicillin-binding protein 2 [Candidatus Nanopelagicales bacterium]